MLGIVKKQTSETLRALGLLVFFLAGAIAGILLIRWQFGPWKDSHFGLGGWSASTAGASASYFVFIGFCIFSMCTACVVNLLRNDLRHKRKCRK
jgi:hypothetical protein